MDDKSWIKLYRKTLLNGILRDHTAWTLFTWMLLTCNRKGQVIVSRFTTSRALQMNPSTFRHALERLEKKHQTVATTKANKYTVVQIVNWAKYQTDNGDEATFEATTRPPKGHQKATYTRIENREYINNTSKEIIKKSFKGLEDITPDDLQEIAAKYRVSLGRVGFALESLRNYCASRGKKYTDYKAALRNFVLKDIKTTLEGGTKHGIDASNL